MAKWFVIYQLGEDGVKRFWTGYRWTEDRKARALFEKREAESLARRWDAKTESSDVNT